MNSDFYMAVKSTVDKLGVDLAASLSATPIDLDDNTSSDDALASPAPGIIWQLLAVDEYPQDPLYVVSFVIGAKTSRDPGSYSLMQFTSGLNQSVYKGAQIDVRDYSGASPGAVEGKLFVTEVELSPQQGDSQQGLRLLSVGCRALRV